MWANQGKVAALNTPNGRLYPREELERVMKERSRVSAESAG